MAKHHLVITGTGRAGTTALVQLLDACGFDTRADTRPYHSAARAGLETVLTADDPPYVVKSPYLSEDLGQIIAEGFDPTRIDAIIVPIRDLDDAVASRVENFLAVGGLWRAKRPSQQRRLLAEALHQLLSTATEHQIRVVLINFPRFVNDPDYTCDVLHPLVPQLDKDAFRRVCGETLRPDLVTGQKRYSRARLLVLDARWAVVKVQRRVLRAWRRYRPAA